MDVLRKLLGVLVVILLVVLGAGFYLTKQMSYGPGQMNMQNPPSPQLPKADQIPRDKIPDRGKQKVNIVLEPDLRNYIDDINKGIGLINEANGLITSDPFFSDPPKVVKGKGETTPFDKLIPKDRDKPVLVLPDGTYQVIEYSGLNLRDVHRGIYKLGQGMTVLNNVLDRMNEDIKINNFPFRTNIPGANNYSPNATPDQNWNYYRTNPYDSSSNMANMPGMNAPQQTMTQGIFRSGIFTNFLYLVIIAFVLLLIYAIYGFVTSLFKEGKS